MRLPFHTSEARTSAAAWVSLCIALSLVAYAALYPADYITPLEFHVHPTTNLQESRNIPPERIRSVVRISLPNSRGTGVAIGAHVVLTAAHVLGDAKTCDVHLFSDGGFRVLRGRVLYSELDTDLTLIETDEPIPHTSALGVEQSHALVVGEPVCAIGAMMGNTPWNCSMGYFSGRGTLEPANTLWQASSIVYMGNSGGPLFDTHTWSIVGIVVQAHGPSVGFVCADEVSGFLRRAAK